MPATTALDTQFIESLIAEHCAGAESDPQLRDLLAVVAERSGIDAGNDELDKGVRLVLAYIGQVPYMMKVAWTAASNVGLEKEMRQIMEAVQSYWEEEDDVIPDELGAIGLLDDAYCSMSLLQAVSDHYRLQTGKHLFPTDLGQANRAIRQVIGEPYASELDRIVIRTMRQAGLLGAIESLAGEEKRLDFEHNSTIWNHGPAGQMDMSDLERLGIDES